MARNGALPTHCRLIPEIDSQNVETVAQVDLKHPVALASQVLESLQSFELQVFLYHRLVELAPIPDHAELVAFRYQKGLADMSSFPRFCNPDRATVQQAVHLREDKCPLLWTHTREGSALMEGGRALALLPLDPHAVLYPFQDLQRGPCGKPVPQLSSHLDSQSSARLVHLPPLFREAVVTTGRQPCPLSLLMPRARRRAPPQTRDVRFWIGRGGGAGEAIKCFCWQP